jgi:hypothetical protein
MACQQVLFWSIAMYTEEAGLEISTEGRDV